MIQAPFKAGGNIRRARAVKISGQFTVSEAGANEQCIGIAVDAARDAPTDYNTTNYAAVAGDSLKIYGPGEVTKALAGGTITAGQNLITDAQGRLVAAATTGTTVQNILCEALSDAILDQMVDVIVKPLAIRPALA